MVKRYLVGYDSFSCHVVITLCTLHVYVLDILSVGSSGSMIRAPALFVVMLIGEAKPDVAIANIAKNKVEVGQDTFLFSVLKLRLLKYIMQCQIMQCS